jgi:flagellar hook-associated protein 1 FlgK
MADILALLSNAASSLAAHRAATATASNNLQNANTPGYARQRAELTATLPADFMGRGFLGRGVELSTISQARDRFIEQQIPGAMGSQARSSAEADALSAVSSLDPEAANGLGAALGKFYSALRALSQNAGDVNLRQTAVSASNQLALAFNRTAKALESARGGVDAKIPGVLREANDAASTVARLNKEIRVARATGHEPNDLLDARQRAVDKLASTVGGTPVPNADGDINIALPGGGTLVTGTNAGVLSTIADVTNNGHLAIQVTAIPGGPAVTLGTNVLGGQVGGLLDARDGAMRDAGNGLDTLAFDLGTTINNVHRAGFDLNGAPGVDLFVTGAITAGAAARLALDATVRGNPRLLAASSSPTTVPGDSVNMLALVATESTALSTGFDAGGTLSQITSQFGTAAARAQAMFEQDAGILNHLSEMRESVSGVSIDEEMINLTKAQRAFEATMKVITTADQMLSTLLQIR